LIDWSYLKMSETASALYDRVKKAEKVAANRHWPNQPKDLDKPKPKRVRSDAEKQYRRLLRRGRTDDDDDLDFHFRLRDLILDDAAAGEEQEGG
jgi:hypothetical protein